MSSKEDESTEQTGRERRTLESAEVFTTYAGEQLPAGASVDTDGNPDGIEYDLGAEGVYQGKKILVIQQYTREGFDFSKPQAALEKKGFTIKRYTKCPDKETLLTEIYEANQLWLISESEVEIDDYQMEVILNAWNDGMALYVFGDNDPYFKDANRLLDYMGLPTMSGNYAGSQKLGEYDGATGFTPHFLTTGLKTLFEGITIAKFDKEAVATAGCEPIMFNSEGNITAYLKHAEEGKGPVVVDGAFTKLYCEWDEAGSARFVRNCACYLGAKLASETA